MQGYTSAPLRHLFHLLAPDVILWTEMEKVGDLQDAAAAAAVAAGGNLLYKRFGPPNHSDYCSKQLVLQLGGNNPQAMEGCVSALGDLGYHFEEINLNCGCPSIQTGGADYGASLMKEADTTRQLIEAIDRGCHWQSSSSTTTISIKCRTAVFETVDDMSAVMGGPPAILNAWKEEQFQTLCHYISQCQKGGIGHVVLHARPAILAGLSSSKNRVIPPLDYTLVEQVAQEFPGLRVTLNGGIKCMAGLDELMQQQQHEDSMVASHMSGRWMLQHPLELALVQSKFMPDTSDSAVDGTNSQTLFGSAIDKYMHFVTNSLNQKIHTLPEVCLPLYLVIEELREISDNCAETEDNACHRMEETGLDAILPSEEDCYSTMRDALERLIDAFPSKNQKVKELPTDIDWKKISSNLKTLVGTKVYNKWKRNRNELVL